MKKIIGWILFSICALAVLAYIGFLGSVFVVYFKDINNADIPMLLQRETTQIVFQVEFDSHKIVFINI